MEEVQGNIFSQSILEILNTPKFQQYWDITKDMIDVCKDCEFRYTCVDSRVPQKNGETNNYCFTDKCKYNPYNNTFNEK